MKPKILPSYLKPSAASSATLSARYTAYTGYAAYAGRQAAAVSARAIRHCVDFLLPQHCALCQQPVLSADRTHNGQAFRICQWCRDALPGCNAARCTVCGMRISVSNGMCNTGQQCPGCRLPGGNRPLQQRSTTSVMGDYLPPLSGLIRLFKYRHHIHLGAALVQVHVMQLLNLQARGALPTPAWPDCLVPVPLHPDRIRSRGFNQAAVLTRHYSRALRCRADLATLVRVDNSGTRQAGKSRRERLQPQAIRFEVCGSLSGQRIALVDDVMTTGATLNAATQALLQAGAASVTRFVIARTP